MSDHEPFDDYEGHDPYDYDYYGPNSEHHGGFGGHGFNPDDDPEKFPDDECFTPKRAERSLERIREESPKLYEELNACIFFFSKNRYHRLRKKGVPTPWEKVMEGMEADIDAGYLLLANATVVVGNQEVLRLCLFEFNPFTGEYDLSIDSVCDSEG